MVYRNTTYSWRDIHHDLAVVLLALELYIPLFCTCSCQSYENFGYYGKHSKKVHFGYFLLCTSVVLVIRESSDHRLQRTLTSHVTGKVKLTFNVKDQR